MCVCLRGEKRARKRCVCELSPYALLHDTLLRRVSLCACCVCVSLNATEPRSEKEKREEEMWYSLLDAFLRGGCVVCVRAGQEKGGMRARERWKASTLSFYYWKLALFGSFLLRERVCVCVCV